MPCPDCGYDLSGIPGVAICPECGTPLLRFTDRARAVMMEANRHAQEHPDPRSSLWRIVGLRPHRAIEPIHVLLAIISGPHGVARHCLASLGCDIDALRAKAEDGLSIAQAPASARRLPPALRTRKLIVTACDHAKRLNHTWVGTEHLLLALCDAKTSMLLAHAGVVRDRVEPVILGNMERIRAEQPPSANQTPACDAPPSGKENPQ